MKPIASLGLCNTASLNIYEFEYGINDYVIVGLNNEVPRKYKLHHNTKGTFFNWGKHRYYLGEFILI